MTQYINKADVVSEIEKRQKEEVFYDEDGSFASWIDQYHYSILESIKNFLDTLEVKEVDLKKEINKYISDNFFGSQTMGFFAARTKKEPNDQDIAVCAKHFFELGLKAQKGE